MNLETKQTIQGIYTKKQNRNLENVKVRLKINGTRKNVRIFDKQRKKREFYRTVRKKEKKNSRSKCNKLIFVGHKSLTPGEVCNLLRQYFSQLYTEQASEYSDAKHLSSTAKT